MQASFEGIVGGELVVTRSETPPMILLKNRSTKLHAAPVVHAGNTASFFREHRPDDMPFAVAEFISPIQSSLFGLES